MKVTSPLLSKTASGTFAGLLTFSHKQSGQMCRFQRKQKDRHSSDQNTQRVLFKTAVCACSLMEFGVLNFGISLFGNQLVLYTRAARSNHLTNGDQCIKEYLSL